MTSMGLSGSIDLEVDWCRFCLVGGRTGGAIEVCRGRSALGGPAAGAQRIQFQRMGLWRWKDQRNATCCWEGATLIIAGLDPVVRITPHLWAIRRPFGKGPTKPGLGDETDHHSYQPVNTRDDPPSTQFMYNIYIYISNHSAINCQTSGVKCSNSQALDQCQQKQPSRSCSCLWNGLHLFGCQHPGFS